MTLVIHDRPSPNYGARPAGAEVNAIVLHADASPREASTISWLQNMDSRVSYHYLVSRRGEVYRFVDPDHRAWHAGKSKLGADRDCNDYSIGVAFGNRNDGVEPYPDGQLAAGVALIAGLVRQYPAIRLTRIVTHAHVSPRRKTDPGPCFPLDRFLARICCALDGDILI